MTQDIQKTVAAVLDQPAASGPPPTASEPPVMPPAQAEPAPGVGGPPTPGAPKTAAKKRKAKKKVKRIIALVVALALLAGGAFAVWYFLLRKTVEQGELLRDVVRIDTIQSKVEGSGNARAGQTAAITLNSSGTVQDVYVEAGQTVMEGDPLYSIYSPAAQDAVKDAQDKLDEAPYKVQEAQDAVTDAQEALAQAKEALAQAPQDAQDKIDAAQDAVKDAQEALADAQKKVAELQEQAGGAVTVAPFAGRLIEVAEGIRVGDELSAGSKIATLANDSEMRLTLNFSYAYENSIYVGQKADVSIPAMMLSCPGTVTAVHKIQKIAPEGAILFEAEITISNPGVLTEGMEATGSMTASDGSDIFPYDSGKLDYSEKRELTAGISGKVLGAELRTDAAVSAGQVLVVQSSEDMDEQIHAAQKDVEAKQKGVAEAEKKVPLARKEAERDIRMAEREVRDKQKAVERAIRDVDKAKSAIPDAEAALEKAQADLEALNAVSPISGEVTSCTLNPGDEVKSGDTVITISDTTNMVVELRVNDQNIGFVTPGMTVELKDWNENMWIGTVTKIDMNPSSDNSGMGMGGGVTTYPVTLTVENYDGSLKNGVSLQYSFVASQADNCLVVPNQAVKSAMDEEGNELTVVFIEAESRPENAVAMPEQSPDMPKKYPTEEEGFYAVPVTTGLSDTYNVEIRSGLNEGDTVFTNYLSASGDSWGMYG